MLASTSESGRNMEKNALITGATAGIGREFADCWPPKDILWRWWPGSEPPRRTGQITGQPGTKSASSRWPEIFPIPHRCAEFSTNCKNGAFPSPCLINNAGFGVYGSFAETDLGKEMEMLQVNMGSLVQLTKLFLKPMLDNREGRILNVASTVSFHPAPAFRFIRPARRLFCRSPPRWRWRCGGRA